MKRRLLILVFLFIISIQLNACLISSGVSAGITAKKIYDSPGTAGDYVEDTYLEFEAVRILRLDSVLAKNWLHVDVNDQVVVVNGNVDNQADNQRVGELLKDISGVKRIINNVIIGNQGQGDYFFDDCALTLKVRQALIMDITVKSLLVDIYSNKYRVYLSGWVSTRKEESRIIALAEEQGAWKVISFIIVKENE